MSRLPPLSTKPCIKLVLGALSPGIKQPRLEDVFLPHLVPRLWMRAAICPFSLYACMVSTKHLYFFFTWMYIKQKDKVHPRTNHEGQEREQRYSSTLSLTGLEGGGWWTPCPRLANLLPGKGLGTHCTYKWLHGPQDQFGWVQEILTSTRIQSLDHWSSSKLLYPLCSPGWLPSWKYYMKLKQ
jgi:hypothetical protein